MILKKIIIVFLVMAGLNARAYSQSLYFPPISPAQAWDTLSASSLGWCVNYVDSLYDFLGQNNTKGFILLKDGKIVLEKYFGSFTQDSIWYWASAGKTLTAFLTGKAAEENFLNITDSVSTYLGTGWTSCSISQEEKITLWHQLTMTTGFDDAVPDPYCTNDTCLFCLADAGTRWAYHNAPYTLLDEVISNATGISLNSFTNSRLKTKTGMTGLWLPIGFNNVFYSNVRSMARFGLLAQNNFIWQNDTLLHDSIFRNNMVNTSQSLNQSYGYLWWLNGKNSFMVPNLQFVFPGWLFPDAPSDMIAALGKDGQVLSIAKSSGILFARMGNSPTGLVPYTICNDIWKKINQLLCNSSSTPEHTSSALTISVYPNPSTGIFQIQFNRPESFEIEMFDLSGRLLLKEINAKQVNIERLQPGVYLIKVTSGSEKHVLKLIKSQ